VGRTERRQQRVARVQAVFGAKTSTALDLLELAELARHDVYGEISPGEEIVDDILVVSQGTLDGLIGTTRLAVTDWRDLKIAADEILEG
jgi:hypothetical protein